MAENESNDTTKDQVADEVTPEELAQLDLVNEILKAQAPEFLADQEEQHKILSEAELASDDPKLTSKDKFLIFSKKTLWFSLAGFVFIGQFLSQQWSFFRALKGLQKVAVVGILTGFLGVAGYFFYIQKKHWVPEKASPLFVNSMEEWSSAKYFFDPKKDREPFYESMRVPRYLFQLSKIYVNLKSSLQSESRSMGAFEFIIEGSVADVTAQIKKSEGKFLDLTQTVVEKFTYDQLETTGGKEELTETLRQAYGQEIDSGLIRKVLIKNMILKP